MAVTIVPLEDRVLVKKDDPEEMSPGGIVIPEVSRRKPQTGTVLAIGPGRVSSEGIQLPMEVLPGQRVVFPKYCGTEVRLGDTLHGHIIAEHEILAIVADNGVLVSQE